MSETIYLTEDRGEFTQRWATPHIPAQGEGYKVLEDNWTDSAVRTIYAWRPADDRSREG